MYALSDFNHLFTIKCDASSFRFRGYLDVELEAYCFLETIS